MDRPKAMLMALALGMLLQDLTISQFGLQDPDDEPDPTIPEYIGESILHFDDLSDAILALCAEITTGITEAHEPPRSSGRPKVARKLFGEEDTELPETSKAKKAQKRGRAGTGDSERSEAKAGAEKPGDAKGKRPRKDRKK